MDTNNSFLSPFPRQVVSRRQLFKRYFLQHKGVFLVDGECVAFILVKLRCLHG